MTRSRALYRLSYSFPPKGETERTALWSTSRVHTFEKIEFKHLNLGFFVCLFGWFLNVLVNYLVISRTGPKTERLTILRAATHETELGDHDFCLSRSHYTDTDPTSRERAATAGIEPGTSSPGVARSTD